MGPTTTRRSGSNQRVEPMTRSAVTFTLHTEATGARKHDVVGVRHLLGAALPSVRPAADVADRYTATAMKHARLQSRGHKQQITNSRT